MADDEDSGWRPIGDIPAFEGIPNTPPPGERSILGDIRRGFMSSAVGTLAAGVGAAEYAFGSGGTLTSIRESLTRMADEYAQGMSPQMQAALAREFVPGGEGESAWSSFGNFFGSVAAQAVATTGSLLAAAPAILAAGMAGPYAVPAAAVVAAATGGVLGAGTVWNDAAQAFQALTEEQRLRNPTYAALRERGVDAAEAIDITVREALRGAVELAGAGSAAINAATGPFLARIGTRSTDGVLSGARRGFVTEAPTETAEEGLQADQSARARERLTGEAYSARGVLESAARGALAGGALGAGLGGVGGAFSRSPAEVEAPSASPASTPGGSGTVASLDPSLVAAAADVPAPPASPPAPPDELTMPDPLGAMAWSAAQSATPASGTQTSVDPSLGAALEARGGVEDTTTPSISPTPPTPPAPTSAIATTDAASSAPTTPAPTTPAPTTPAPPPAEPATQAAPALLQELARTDPKRAEQVKQTVAQVRTAIQDGLLPVAPTQKQIREVLGVSASAAAMAAAIINKANTATSALTLPAVTQGAPAPGSLPAAAATGSDPTVIGAAAGRVEAAQENGANASMEPTVPNDGSAPLVSPRTGEPITETTQEPKGVKTAKTVKEKVATKKSADEKRAEPTEQKVTDTPAPETRKPAPAPAPVGVATAETVKVKTTKAGAKKATPKIDPEVARLGVSPKAMVASKPVAQAVPQSAAKPEPKAREKGRVADAKQMVREQIAPVAKRAMQRALGNIIDELDITDPKRAAKLREDTDTDALVNAIIDDAVNEIEGIERKAPAEIARELLTLVRSRVGAAVKDAVERIVKNDREARLAQEAAEDAERAKIASKTKEERKRSSTGLIQDAINGDETATRQLLGRIGATLQRNLPALYRRINAVFETMEGKTEPDWLTELRIIAESAKPGGSSETKSARNAAVAKLQEYVDAARGRIATRSETRSEEVERIFDEGAADDPAAETARDRMKRYAAMRKAVAKALGVASVNKQLELLKDANSRAGAIVQFLARAGRGTDKNFDADVSESFALPELLIRSGNSAQAMEIMREQAAEGRGTPGEAQLNEDGDSFAREESSTDEDTQLDNLEISSAQLSALRREAERLNIEALQRQADARSATTLPAPDEEGEVTYEEALAARAALRAAQARKRTAIEAARERIAQAREREHRALIAGVKRQNTLTLSARKSDAASAANKLSPKDVALLVDTQPVAVLYADDPLLLARFGTIKSTSLDRGLLDTLQARVGNVPIHVVPDAVWDRAAGRATGVFMPNTIANVKEGAPAGIVYIPESVLTNTNTALLRETVLHELVHAGTYASVLTANSAGRAKLQKLMNIVRDGLRERGLPPDMIDALRYSLTSPEEFIAVAMTNGDVQQVLLDIPVTPEQRKSLGLLGVIRNAFQAFVQWARQALGLPPGFYSVMEAVIEIADRAIQSPQTQRAQLAAMTNPRLADIKNPGAYASMFSALDRVGSYLSSEALGTRASNASTNIGQTLKRIGFGFTTLRQLEMIGAKLFTRDARINALFPNNKDTALQVVTKAFLRRNTRARDLVKDFVGPLKAFDALPKRSQETVSVLLLDATRAEVHPDSPLGKGTKNEHMIGTSARQVQGRARHAALARRFNALTQAEKRAYQETVAVFERAHQTAVRTISDFTLDSWFKERVDANLRDPARNPLPVTYDQLQDMKPRAIADALTDAEKTMLGEDVVKALANARNRNKMKGPYVPLQRFGDYVVTWRENAPEVVSFATQEEADTFTESTPYEVLDRTKHYFDKAGNEITEPDPLILRNEEGVALSALGPNPSIAEQNAAKRQARETAMKKTRANAARVEFRVKQQIQGYAIFETLAEANSARAELAQQGKNVDQVAVRNTPAERASALKDADYERLKESIAKDESIPREFREQAIDALASAFVTITPNRTLQASLIKRRKVIGASEDIRRVIANYGIAVSNFTAGMESALPITMGLKSMREQERIGRKTATDDGSSVSRGDLLREIEKRVLESPVEAGGGRGSEIPWVRKLQSMAYIFFLATPSYSMIQMTQPWMLSLPVIGARYGMPRAARAMGKAMSDVGGFAILKGGLKDAANAAKAYVGTAGDPQPILTEVKARLAQLPQGAELVTMLDTLETEGLVDGEAGLELVRAELLRDGRFGRFLSNTEALARAFPAAIEVLNRTSTAVAAYRLARANGANPETATQIARESVDLSQADYSSANTARYMDPRRYPWTAPMMTFRKYAQAVYYLLIRNTYQMFKDSDPEVRRVARRTLGYTLAAHGLIAGVLGLPTEVIGWAIGLTSLLFGADEPWDWEKEVRLVLSDALGPEAAEAVARGLPRVLGVDLHGRMGLNSLLFMHDLRDFESRTMIEYAGNVLLGAPGAMLAGILSAPQAIADGQGIRAIEAAVPKGISDVLRAIRFEKEGITTRRGERIDGRRRGEPGLDTMELIVQALGFTPARVAEVYERRDAVQGANRRLTEERNGLLRRYRQADPSERRDVWQEIVEWNRSLPPQARGVRITRESLIRSIRESERRARRSGGEDYLPRGREFLREEGRFANTER